MTEKKKSGIASLTLALISLVWGTSYAVTKDILDVVEPFTLMMIRFVGATLFLSIIYYKKLFKINKTDLKSGLIIGLAMFGAFYTLIVGIQYTAVSKQTFLIGSFVIIVPFLRWIINNKKPDFFAIIGAILALVGLAMLTLGGIEKFNRGDFFSLLCAVFFALHMITIEKYCNDSDPIILSILQFAVTGFIFILLSYKYESFNFSAMKNAKFSVAYLVLISTVLAFLVQNIVQKFISSTSVALILTLESAFGSVFAVYYLGEQMSTTMVVACTIILTGIIIQETKLEFLKKVRSR